MIQVYLIHHKLLRLLWTLVHLFLVFDLLQLRGLRGQEVMTDDETNTDSDSVDLRYSVSSVVMMEFLNAVDKANPVKLKAWASNFWLGGTQN